MDLLISISSSMLLVRGIALPTLEDGAGDVGGEGDARGVVLAPPATGVPTSESCGEAVAPAVLGALVVEGILVVPEGGETAKVGGLIPTVKEGGFIPTVMSTS